MRNHKDLEKPKTELIIDKKPLQLAELVMKVNEHGNVVVINELKFLILKAKLDRMYGVKQVDAKENENKPAGSIGKIFKKMVAKTLAQKKKELERNFSKNLMGKDQNFEAIYEYNNILLGQNRDPYFKAK